MITALDTEYRPATNAEPVPRLVSLAACSGSGAVLLTADDSRLPELARDAFRGGAIFHTAPSDVHVILRHSPSLLADVLDAYEGGRIHDVGTREKLIDIAEGKHRQRGGYDLGSISERRAGLDVDKSDPWRLRYGELDGVPIDAWPAEAKSYAIADPCATWAVWLAQERFRGQHTLDVFEDAPRQARGHLALWNQTLRGILTDPDEVERVDSWLRSEIASLAMVLVRYGLARVVGKKNPKVQCDTKTAMEMLKDWAERTGAPLQWNKKGVSLSEDALVEADVPKDHPLGIYRRFNSLRSLRSKSVPVLRRPIVRTRYDELVDTGRVSSSGPQGNRKVEDVPPEEWCGTNFQNQATPRKLIDRGFPEGLGFRECLVPPPGYRFILTDYGAMELVGLAQVQIDLFGRSSLADALANGSPHDAFACRVLGIPVDQLDKKIPEHADARQLAKAWNFGKPGGMGQKRFIKWALGEYGVRVTAKQEREYTRMWKREFPEIDDYFDHIRSLQGIDGKHVVVQHRSNRIRGGCSFPEAANTKFQGIAADAMKLALWWLLRASLNSSSALYAGPDLVESDGNVPRTGGVLVAHDENVTQAPVERADAALVEQETIMKAACSVFCPDVPVQCESAIVERYCK